MKKKNIKTIPDSTDFHDLFNVKKTAVKREESFEELLKASEKDPELKELQEKKLEHFNMTLSRKERIKSYPQPQDKCDLHGLTSSESELVVEKFINESKQVGLKTVRVITGKGHHSTSGPVLRDKIEIFANSLKKDRKILGWNWEKKYKEKSGSIIFYLL